MNQCIGNVTINVILLNHSAINIYDDQIMKSKFNNNGQQFLQYQTKRTTISRPIQHKKTAKHVLDNPDPGLGQAHTCRLTWWG